MPDPSDDRKRRLPPRQKLPPREGAAPNPKSDTQQAEPTAKKKPKKPPARRLPPKQTARQSPPKASPNSTALPPEKKPAKQPANPSEPPADRAPSVAPTKPQQARGRFGKYAIRGILGKGGMGAVYLAEDVELSRLVALKILPKDKAQNATLVKRFKAEGQAAARLNHPNIVKVHEAGEINGQAYMALEYIQGTDAHGLLVKKGMLDPKQSTAIVRQVAEALRHAEELGIVHRDIKPSNLMIDGEGHVKLADMGLARSLADTEEAGITRAGTTVGTVDFMPPEQARDSKAADVRSDIYALGGTWYQLLTTQVPFPGGDLTNKLRAHATAPRPNPRDVNPEATEALTAVLHRMMAIDPTQRHQSAAALIADLDSLANAKERMIGVLFDDLPMPETDELTDLSIEHLPDEDGKAPKPRRKGGERAKGGKRTKGKSGDRALPPRESKKGAVSVEGSGLNLDIARNVVIAAAIIAAVVGVGYVLSGLIDPFESGEGDLAGIPQPGATDAPEVPGAGPEKPDEADAPAPKPPSDGLSADDRAALAAMPAVGELPAWASKVRLDRAELPSQITVEAGQSGAGTVGTLGEAIAALGPRGGRITLADPGPHRLDAASLAGQRLVRIDAAPGTLRRDGRPVVEMAIGDGEAILTADRTSLALHDLEIQLRDFASDDRPAGPVTLFDIRGGSLDVRGTTIQTRDVPAIAFRLGEADGRGIRSRTAGQAYLEGVSLVGDDLIGLDQRASGGRTMIASSAIGTRSTAVQVHAPTNAPGSLAIDQATLAGGTAIALSSDAKRPQLEVSLGQSRLVGTTDAATGLAIGDWPTGRESRYEGLTIRPQMVAFIGTPQLADLGSGLIVRDAARFAETLSATLTASHVAAAADPPRDALIEPRGEAYPLPTPEATARADAWDTWARPSVPPFDRTGDVDFDPETNGDLASYLAGGCPDRTVVHVVGDRVTLGAATLKGKSVAIRPRGRTCTVVLDGDFTVDSGGLLLEDLTLEHTPETAIALRSGRLRTVNVKLVSREPTPLVRGDAGSQLSLLETVAELPQLAGGELAVVTRNFASVGGRGLFSARPGGTLHLFDSTFVLDGPLLAMTLDSNATDSVRVWTERCVLAASRIDAPAVAATRDSDLDRLVWFDDRLAIDDRLATAEIGTSRRAMDESAWRSLASQGQHLGLIVGPGAVRMASDIPYALDPAALAATGARDGSALGTGLPIGPPEVASEDPPAPTRQPTTTDSGNGGGTVPVTPPGRRPTGTTGTTDSGTRRPGQRPGVVPGGRPVGDRQTGGSGTGIGPGGQQAPAPGSGEPDPPSGTPDEPMPARPGGRPVQEGTSGKVF